MFDAIPGLQYAIDLSQPARFDTIGTLVNPAARRIVGLSLDGQPLAPDRRLVLVTNSHRASLAAAARPKDPPRVILAEGIRTQDVLARHVRAQGVVGHAGSRHWHFLPMPGTTVICRAGVGSAAHLGDLGALRPCALGQDEQGFDLYRLHL